MNSRLKQLKMDLDSRTRNKKGQYKSNNIDRALLNLGYIDSVKDPDIIRRAKGYLTYFQECDIFIHPNELFVGYINQGLFSGGFTKEDRAISGHFSVDYEMMVNIGINGALERIDKYRKQNVKSKGDRADNFYDACEIVLKGFQEFILRYKVFAISEIKRIEEGESILKDTERTDRIQDLTLISESLENIAYNPPKTIHEAIQLILLYHMVIQFQVGCCSFGRPDRYLYPFYKKEISEGKDDEYIKELLGAWFIKINEFMEIPQGMMIGGQDKNGNPIANELTILIIQTMREIKTVNPALGFSWNEKIPRKFMEEVVLNYKDGIVNPALFNDDTIIKSQKRMGVAHEHAVNYINCTCTEITPVGFSNIFVVADYININDDLLETIHHYKEINTYEEFKESFFSRFRGNIKIIITDQITQQEKRINTFGQPLISIFMHNCLETGLDISWGGALYNFAYPQLVGLPTAADSLYVIKRLIFENREYTLKEFSKILKKNWRRNEDLRQKIINKFPKWGNDQDEVDSIGLEIIDVYYDEVEKYNGVFKNGGFYPGFLCWVTHERFGKILGATPDGRQAKKPVSNSIAPAAGRGRNGLTAVINSAAKIDQVRGSGSSVLNLSLLKSNLETEEQIQKYIDLFETYFIKGGFQIQINVSSRELLIDAQKHPENYMDLIVKVGGYSAHFCNLSKSLQDEIIARNFSQ